MGALQDVLEKVDIPIDGDLAALLQQRVAALQDIPQAPDDFLLLLALRRGASRLACPVRSSLQQVTRALNSKCQPILAQTIRSRQAIRGDD